MSHRDKVLEILESTKDVREASEYIYKRAPRELALYVITVGIDRLKAVKRRSVRRELKREVAPQFQKGRVTGSVVFTPKTKQRIVEHAQRLFVDWQIDANITLGNATKEELLAKAQAERSSAHGHIRTAMFYEAIAEPLKSGQRAHEYWSKERAVEVKRKIWKETERGTAALV